MPLPASDTDARISRRAVLAGFATGGLVTTSGCVRRARSIVGRDDPDPLSLTITTVPDDVDRHAVVIADTLKDNLEAVGIDVSIDYRAVEEFYREVLINHGFDLFVGRLPDLSDPDDLYEALHSRFVDESGYQNPYGYANLAVDDLLERQRRTDGEERRAAVADLLEAVVVDQPFVPLAVPVEHRLVRTDRIDGWNGRDLTTRRGFLDLEPADGVDDLRAVVTDPRVTENFNPLSAAYRNQGLYVDLVYDSLALVDGDELRPWLAEGWAWSDDQDGTDADSLEEPTTGRTVTVTLRPDLTFHDGEPLTAADVAFTYRLVADTTLGAGSVRSPASRYRGRVSVIDALEVHDERTLTITTSAGREATARAFTVPILPAHVWEERTGTAQLTGVSVAQGTTEAVVTDNVPPVGSGPFRFVDVSERQSLSLERFDDHFSLRVDDLPAPTVETFSTHVEPRSPAAIEAVEGDSADVTIHPLESYTIDDVTETTDVELHTQPSRVRYLIGFNARRAPFANPNARRTVARLLDKSHLVDSVFGGHAEAVATPLTGEWVPDDLAFDGEDPAVPFFGTEGDLDAEAARDAFERAGYRYDPSGSLLVRR
ncbi:ABC transporter substrate-binding protein [Natronobiforma cellulositropha]|uniref:ABC transporter substrate-binding protein n=1 Tax=Natronobiforma cellulositropha TaxID=1679076 RepID=UPI0021D59DC4|nr:ABC transporter substrate-binding protein [Natronobiforma cellulositropha]